MGANLIICSFHRSPPIVPLFSKGTSEAEGFKLLIYNFLASACYVLASASHVLASASHVLASVSHVLASASHVLASASRVLASASHVLASASHVLASASRVLASVSRVLASVYHVPASAHHGHRDIIQCKLGVIAVITAILHRVEKIYYTKHFGRNTKK